MIFNNQGDYAESHGFSEGEALTLKQKVVDVEKQALEKALKQYGSARKVAKYLNLSHTAILKKVHRYDLGYLLRFK